MKRNLDRQSIKTYFEQKNASGPRRRVCVCVCVCARARVTGREIPVDVFKAPIG